MAKHMLKLLWNRKRSNALIGVEIFFSFLVVLAVASLGVFYADNYRHPLGFEYERAWSIDVGGGERRDGDKGITPESAEEVRQIVRTLRDMPEIEAVGGIELVPFHVGASQGDRNVRGKRIMIRFNGATPELEKALGIEILQGRWFQEADALQNYDAVVINEKLARETFGGENPVGQALINGRNRDEREQRVIGVVRDFRQHGQLHALYPYSFSMLSFVGLEKTGRAPRLIVRLRPGVGPEFEEKLMQQLQSAAHDRNFKIEALTKARKSHMKLQLAPVVSTALVAAFLIAMVALGMVGVVWQTVTRRSREIGLRRAVGSTADSIYRQILGELLIVASGALLVGVLLVIQIPLLQLVDWFSNAVWFVAIALSVLLMYGVTLLAGLYPSWMATRVQPADVLRYE